MNKDQLIRNLRLEVFEAAENGYITESDKQDLLDCLESPKKHYEEDGRRILYHEEEIYDCAGLRDFIARVIKESGNRRLAMCKALGLSKMGVDHILNKTKFTINDANRLLNVIGMDASMNICIREDASKKTPGDP